MQKLRLLFTNFKNSIIEFEKKFIRSKYLIIVIPALVFLLAFLLYAPYIFNNKDLRYQIEQKISEYTKGNLEIKGEIRVKLLPTPSLIIKKAILKNYISGNKNYNLYIEDSKVELSFLSTLTGKFNIQKVTLNNIIAEIHNSQESLELKSEVLKAISKKLIDSKEQEGVGGNIFSVKSLNLNNYKATNFPDLEIKNGRIISYSKLGNKKEIEELTANFSFSRNLISGQGSFKNQDLLNNFTLSLHPNSKKNDSIFKLSSTYADLKIYGTFYNIKNKSSNFGNYFEGTLESEIFNLKNFYKSYISSDGYIFNKINPKQTSIKIKALVKKNNHDISIEKAAISSDIINGRGDIFMNFNSTIPLIDVVLDLENFNLDSILTRKNIAVNKKNLVQPKKKDISAQSDDNLTKNFRQASFELSKDLRDIDLTLETKINRVRYLAEQIQNVDLYSTISKNGEILILPLSFRAPDGGKFRVIGAIENRDSSPKFLGKIDAKGSKLANILRWLKLESQNLKYNSLNAYSIYSDVMLVPNTTIFNNFYLNFNNKNTELLGDITIRYGNSAPDIISNFEVHNFDIDEYFLTSSKNSYFSPGDLLKKVLWLNSLSSRNELTLTFDKLSYKNLLFKNHSLKSRFGPGYLEIDNFNLESDNFNLNTSLAIDITRPIPNFDISLKSKNFQYSPSIYKQSENSAAPILAKTIKINAIDRFFALPSLEKFSGNVFIDFEKANIDNFEMSDLKSEGRLKKGQLEFSKFSAKSYGKSLKFEGAAAIKFEKTISGNLYLEKTLLKPYLKAITQIDNISGVANISSSISSFGENKEEFLKNLNSQIKFKAANLKVENLGLDDLVKKMFNPFYFQAELEDPLAILQNPDAVTNLKKASGEISISRGKLNRFKIKFSGTALNGLTSGKFDLVENKIDGSSNIIFLTGTKERQIPINIVSNYKGRFYNMNHGINLKQAKQYINSVKEQINKGATKIIISGPIKPKQEVLEEKEEEKEEKQTQQNMSQDELQQKILQEIERNLPAQNNNINQGQIYQ